MKNFSQLCEDLEDRMLSSNVYFGHGTDNAYDEAVWLACHICEIDLAIEEELPWSRNVSETEATRADNLLDKRISSGKPLAYLINEAWFGGERFYIDQRAIVPRSHLGEWIPDRFEPWLDLTHPRSKILDLCTGSGCIAIALAKSFPEALVHGADLSSAALAVAQINVDMHNLSDRVELFQGDMYDFVDENSEPYDLIVSNPPYVASQLMLDLPDEYGFEPPMAFEGGETGLDFIEQILKNAPRYLSENGVLVVEAGSANVSLEKHFPNIPFTWLSSANGDEVIFLLTAAELKQYF